MALSQQAVTIITYMGLFNVIVIYILFITGLGKDVYQRFLWRRQYKSGKYAYSLMATKSGNVVEVFAKIEENGGFKYNNKPYVMNPNLTKNYRGIPAHFHNEGTPEPKDPWDPENNNIQLSCNELDTVMSAQIEFDLKQWIENNKGTAVIIIGALVIAAAAAAYFGYQNFELLRDFVQRGATQIAAN